MKFKNLLNNKIKPFEYHSVKRPWGYYTNYADNRECTVKVLNVKHGGALSLQFHFKRDQLYLILDDGFVITDGNKVYRAKKGDIFGFPRRHIHRAVYTGGKKFGEILDIAFGLNDEEDIVRLIDKYYRADKTYKEEKEKNKKFFKGKHADIEIIDDVWQKAGKGAKRLTTKMLKEQWKDIDRMTQEYLLKNMNRAILEKKI